jgi:hypothetical protein
MTNPASEIIAQDRDTVREKDKDGRLHVSVANISKANVCPYIGHEVPRYRELGLDPDKIYQLLRDPEELRKSASTFNGLPILSEHQPTSAEDHPHDLVVGATGSGAAYNHPYLQNRLSFWPTAAIQNIEDESKKELSSGYYYDADMTPGTYEGTPFDGVMRNIIGNHIATVPNGRAGADVVVGDSNAAIKRHAETSQGEAQDRIAKDRKPHPLRNLIMTKGLLTRKAVLVQGACMAALTPKLAQDAKIDFAAPFKGVSAKNFKAKKPAIFAALKAATEGKLAQDADIDDVIELLDALDDVSPTEGSDPDPTTSAVPVVEAKPADDADPHAKVKAKMKEKGLSDADIDELISAMEDDEDDGAEDEVVTPKPDTVTKGAMDAAIRAAVTAATSQATTRQVEIREAERAVRPYIGEIAIAHDSADGVYRTALTALGIDVANVHPSAFSAILKLQPVPGAKKTSATPAVAMDSAAVAGFNERIPGAARIINL